MAPSSPSSFQTRVATLFLCVALAFPLSSCGTLFYAERRGQEKGKIDPNIVILDGLGLILFIIPGLVAYAVDFATGAIYLPPGEDPQGPFIGDDGLID